MRTIRILGAACIVLTFASLAPASELKGTVKATGSKHNADAVVYVDAVAGKTFPPPVAHALLDQKNMVFVPHVLPIVVGTTVDFQNSDAVLHNVFSPDKCAEKFNLGSWPQGQKKGFTFKQACAATILCNVHPEMEAFVVAVPTPYFAVTDKSGAYGIKDLPDGAYTIKVWHPKLKETSRQVTVSGVTTADFELSK